MSCATNGMGLDSQETKVKVDKLKQVSLFSRILVAPPITTGLPINLVPAGLKLRDHLFATVM